MLELVKMRSDQPPIFKHKMLLFEFLVHVLFYVGEVLLAMYHLTVYIKFEVA